MSAHIGQSLAWLTAGSSVNADTPDPSLGPWAQARLPASWRGVAFRVRESEIKRGRRQAVHEYPFRDDIWVEDLGRAGRVTAFRGFLVGDDVDAQLRAMVAATEQAGPGTLVHPALGTMQASLVEFAARDSAEQGRVWTLEMAFLSSGQRGQTRQATDSQGTTATAAGSLAAAIQDSFGIVGTTIASGAAGAPTGLLPVSPWPVGQGQSLIVDAQQMTLGVQRTVNGFVRTAGNLVGDVSAISRAVRGVQGNFGRYSMGARLSLVPGLTNAAQALANANAAAASVNRLGSNLSTLVRAL